jgi:hypothetical protein
VRYFLTAGTVARPCMDEDGASAELAVTGSECVIGVALFLGGESTPSQAVVATAGYATNRLGKMGSPCVPFLAESQVERGLEGRATVRECTDLAGHSA